MPRPPLQHSLYSYGLFVRLGTLARRSPLQAHFAYLWAGMALMFMARRRAGPAAPLNWSTLVLTGMILFGGLLALAPILGAMQPALYQAGKVSGSAWLALLLLVMLGWRYIVGRQYLRTFCAERERQLRALPATRAQVHL